MFYVRQLVVLIAFVAPVVAQTINISGRITDTENNPIQGASVMLVKGGQAALSDAAGYFLISNTTNVAGRNNLAASPTLSAALGSGILVLRSTRASHVTTTSISLQGKALWTTRQTIKAGATTIALPNHGAGIGIYVIKSGSNEFILKACSIGRSARATAMPDHCHASSFISAKLSKATEKINDVLGASKNGYLNYYANLNNSEMSGIEIQLVLDTFPDFSFFVTSLKAMRELSGSDRGFGGDLRYGETGDGAGLRGADKICATIAEMSMPGSSAKMWRAFLSVSSDENGNQVNAIDRIGKGPWYDRVGRLLAPTLAALLNTRPQNGDPTIQNDLPNEDGVPNHQPDPNQPAVDNHDFLTGTNEQGQLYGADATCLDWTSALGDRQVSGRPRCGHSWPRRAGGGGSSMENWMSALSEGGCAPGINLSENSVPNQDVTVGCGGGYGGIYCFALNP